MRPKFHSKTKEEDSLLLETDKPQPEFGFFLSTDTKIRICSLSIAAHKKLSIHFFIHLKQNQTTASDSPLSACEFRPLFSILVRYNDNDTFLSFSLCFLLVSFLRQVYRPLEKEEKRRHSVFLNIFPWLFHVDYFVIQNSTVISVYGNYASWWWSPAHHNLTEFSLDWCREDPSSISQSDDWLSLLS